MVIDALYTAVGTVFEPVNFGLIVVAVLFGLFMGMLPGLGGPITLALLIPLTFGMDPIVAFMLLAAAKGSTNFGGSITAILINTPGTSSNAATILDGYPMTQDGRGGEAIGASAVASASGAVIGLLLLFLLIPILIEILFLFGPTEIFWLAVWGLTVISVVVKGGMLKGLISALIGVILAVHGLNIHTNTQRWAYDLTFMIDGWKLVPALIGLFAIAEMITLLSKGGTISKTDVARVHGGQWTGARAVFTHRWLFIRSAIVGFITGMVPAVGGAAANFIAYFQAVQTSKNAEAFGKGDIRGVIASEAANDGKDGGMFVPTLAFGVPGSATMAVLFGAFVLHGLAPGPSLFENNLEIVMVIIIAMFVSNVLTSVVGLLTASYLTRITSVDVRLIAPVVIAIAFFGAFALNGNIFDLFITLTFGLLGAIMIRERMSRVPLILAMVLTPIMERNLYRTWQISRGDYMGFFDSYISIGLIVLIVVSLFLPYIKTGIKRAAITFGLVPPTK